MSQVLLLDKTNSPLHRLALHRLQLDASSPYVAFDTAGSEVCLYSLVGTVTVTADGLPLGTIGGRRSVTERGVQIVRFPAGRNFSVVVGLVGYSADLLLASVEPQESPVKLVDMQAWLVEQAHTPPVPTTPWVHRDDTVWHDVGTGCYRRWVAEVPTPGHFELHCGQTVSDGQEGVWSSWPSHAAPEEVARYAEHEEAFYCLSSGYFLMSYDGIYCTGERALGMRRICNNEALATPLGSHELAVSPGNVGVYVWFYLSFLKKTYNRWSHESISKVYVK